MAKYGPLVVGKDGGEDSNVDGVMFEIKSLFSIGILRFKNGSREAFHSHAFDSVSWLLRGRLIEEFLDNCLGVFIHRAGARIVTSRTDVHRVASDGTSYVFTIRGPWKRTWVDVIQDKMMRDCWYVDTLGHGRTRQTFEWFSSREAAADFAETEAAK